ncbi:MAG: TIGR02646 family protein [uncultured Sulfurovum sp.]|uniref:TIGR02646 family protein n=1 Tax=uncultured Sulfurovum sp. TaxID=269237 RepID=A0A6S6SI50_9BACT|nr:MAG: TIGR02646 family protein [uncultured Sulfurovum sp.]
MLIVNLKLNNTYKQRVEHFEDKSNSTLLKNLHLDWNNLIGVCLGGSDIRNKENPPFRTPANLSCDAYKVNHANILNPLEIQAFPNLFRLNKRTCELEADIKSCKLITIPNNKYTTTEELVTQTIINLNLNCDRLTTDRHKILIAYNKEIGKGRQVQDREVFSKLVEKWFSKRFSNLFTTRRLLLGKHAELFLEKNNYDG